MARNPETKGYVSWRDVMEAQVWYQQGYGLRFVWRGVVACPPGEQHYGFYWELVACDGELEPIALGQRVLFRFPQQGAATLPGAMLGALYRMDHALSEKWAWAEPTIGRLPEGGAR